MPAWEWWMFGWDTTPYAPFIDSGTIQAGRTDSDSIRAQTADQDDLQSETLNTGVLREV